MNWDLEIEKLKHYVFEKNYSYEKIGRIYNRSGTTIKKALIKRGNTKHKYCSNSCQQEYEYKLWIEKYKQDNSIAKPSKWGQIPSQLRRYIFEKFENKCCLCGWSEINPYTNTLPLEIDHIDGNSENNSEENLRLICSNCHSLTPTYRGANRGNGRNITWVIKSENKSLSES